MLRSSFDFAMALRMPRRHSEQPCGRSPLMWGKYPPSLVPLQLLIAEKTGITGYEFNFVHSQDRMKPVSVTLEISRRPGEDTPTPWSLTDVYSDRYECVGDASDEELREEYGRLEEIAVDHVVNTLKEKAPGVVFLELQQMKPARVDVIDKLREQLRSSQMPEEPFGEATKKALLDVYDSLNKLETAIMNSTGDWSGLVWL